jgi:hypothetical protein
VVCVCGCLELFDLFAAKPQFPANPFDPVNSNVNAVAGKLFLQTFRTVGFFRSFMSRYDFEFEPFFLLIPERIRSFQPGVVATG